jgi:hypothetical protein
MISFEGVSLSRFPRPALFPSLRRSCVFVIAVILTFTSCGRRDKKDAAEEAVAEGNFKAVLRPMNVIYSRTTRGGVRVSKYGDFFEVKVSLEGAPPGIRMQQLHEGSSCPGAAADANGDGLVDFAETLAASGKVLVPFDADLGTQLGGFNRWPSGNYIYRRSTSYSMLLADLHDPVNPALESHRKLSGGELPVQGRAVIVYGIGRHQRLPPSVTGISGMALQDTIPIACGILERLDDNDYIEPVVTPPAEPRIPVVITAPVVIDYDVDRGPEPPPDRTWLGQMGEYGRRVWCSIRRRCPVEGDAPGNPPTN